MTSLLFYKTTCATCVWMEDNFLVYDWVYHGGKRGGNWQINYLIQARLVRTKEKKELFFLFFWCSHWIRNTAFNPYLVYIVTLDLSSCRICVFTNPALDPFFWSSQTELYLSTAKNGHLLHLMDHVLGCIYGYWYIFWRQYNCFLNPPSMFCLISSFSYSFTYISSVKNLK